MRLNNLLLATCALAYTSSLPVLAQEAGDSEDLGLENLDQNPPQEGDEESQKSKFYDVVVVTANRREELLQRVPIAVTAVTAADLSASGVVSNTQLARKAPSLQMTYTGGALLPYIRGIGSNNPSPGDETPIATYIDGVYQSRSYATNFSFNNIQRVEVLKGPQGTLFGRNAAGGLIQVITKDPVHEVGGEVSASYGNYDTFSLQSYTTGGITDSVAADLALYYSNQGRGYGKNVFTGNEYGKNEDFAVRSKWKYSQGGTDIALSLDYRSLETDRPLGLRSPPGTRNIYGELPPSDFQDIVATEDPGLNIESWGIALNARHDLGFADLVSISAYRQSDLDYEQDGDTSPIDGIYLIADEEVRTFSQELQLKSNSSGALQWSSGLFYMHDESGYTPFNLRGLDLGSIIDIWSRIDTDSYSVYADATYDISESTELTGGIRWTVDERSVWGFNGISTPDGVPLLDTPEFTDSDSFSRPTWRLILNQSIGPDSILYGSYSRGFKSGGYAAAAITDAPYKSAYCPPSATMRQIGKIA